MPGYLSKVKLDNSLFCFKVLNKTAAISAAAQLSNYILLYVDSHSTAAPSWASANKTSYSLFNELV